MSSGSLVLVVRTSGNVALNLSATSNNEDDGDSEDEEDGQGSAEPKGDEEDEQKGGEGGSCCEPRLPGWSIHWYPAHTANR